MISESSVLLCDKPAGITSHDLVREIKRELRTLGRGGTRRRGPRVGHAGTLDPFATGLLVILTGRATRLQRYLMALPKTYRAVARLGWRSSTGDPDGELTETGRRPDRLELPTGRIRQRLPMTSAVKVGGERLYRKAHRGETIVTPEREVTVHSARLLEAHGDRAEFEITCSAGTYIRTLIETLEDAYCEELRRIAIGHLRVVDGERVPIPISEALAFMPQRILSADEIADVTQGRRIPRGELELPFEAQEEEPKVALKGESDVIAVARLEGERLQPEVVLV